MSLTYPKLLQVEYSIQFCLFKACFFTALFAIIQQLGIITGITSKERRKFFLVRVSTHMAWFVYLKHIARHKRELFKEALHIGLLSFAQLQVGFF